MAKELYVYPDRIKVDDTGTEVSFSLFQNGHSVDFQQAKVAIKNVSGYLLAIDTDGGVFSSKVLKALPPDQYGLEVWLIAEDGSTLIFPDEGFVQIEITANAYTVTGQTIPSLSLQEFKQQIADGIEDLKHQAIQIAMVANEAAAKKASADNPTTLYVWSE